MKTAFGFTIAGSYDVHYLNTSRNPIKQIESQIIAVVVYGDFMGCACGLSSCSVGISIRGGGGGGVTMSGAIAVVVAAACARLNE